MARVIHSTATTLDGFIADLDKSLDWLFDVGQVGQRVRIILDVARPQG